MNAKNLPLKFALFVALPALLCLWSVLLGKGLKPGIDIAGGHVLQFEIKTNEAEVQRLETEKAVLQKKLQDPLAEPERKRAEEALRNAEAELKRLRAERGDPSNLARDMIQVLNDRLDPDGLRNTQWTPIGRTRIEIRMPASSKESAEAKRVYLQALERLREANLQPSEVRRLVKAPGEQREKVIQEIAGGDEALANRLRDFAAADETAKEAVAAVDRLQAEAKALAPDAPEAKRKEIADALAAADVNLKNAKADLAGKRRDLYAGNISRAFLEGILRNYLSPREEKLIRNEDERERRKLAFQDSLGDLRKKHSTRVRQIDEVVELYKKWGNLRQHLGDPADLKRLIRKAGVLEYRISPQLYGGGQEAIRLNEKEIEHYRNLLYEEGPQGALKRNEKYAWFPLRAEGGFEDHVQEDYAGQTYVLLCNAPGFTMLQKQGETRWRLSDAYPTTDAQNRPAVGFKFNEAGARLFAALTARHKGRPMAILLDDEVYSAPNIRSVISQSGIIEGRFTLDEVRDLVGTLKAGSLPARLNPDPVSENTFGPAIGEVNKDKGIRAAYWGLLAVAAFVLVYYLLAGAIANVALLLNIILVLGAMSLFDAVFTLPGIAGVILTIGIAVDANVLIFERLREEQAKKQSIRMALKNAYQRALSAILDANATTLITCLILAWVGTPEVRGFAITLGLGVAFSLFTALVVTRWIFQVLLDARLVKGPVFMLRIIGTPRIDWMGKRYIFWCISILLVALGIGSLIWQGGDIWGIEFSAGTKATITFRPDALMDGRLPNDALVRDQFSKAAEELAEEAAGDEKRQPQQREADRRGYDKLATTARVETVIDEEAVPKFIREYDADGDRQVTLAEWLAKQKGAEGYFALLDADNDKVLTREELEDRLPTGTYQISTTETDLNRIRNAVRQAFGPQLKNRTRRTFDLAKGVSDEFGIELAPDGITLVTEKLAEAANPNYQLEDYAGGVMMVVETPQNPITLAEFHERVSDMRLQPDFDSTRIDDIQVIGAGESGGGTYKQFGVFVTPTDPSASNTAQTWDEFKSSAYKWAVEEPLNREEAMVANNFDAAIAGRTAQQAVMAVILSCAAIVVYLWFRFGSAQWGLAAVICLVHDVIIVVGLVAVSGWLHNSFLGRILGVASFKIDLAMVAATLTVIGYSVNDTIVVFDRIRENRGKLTTVSPQVINASINQTLSRTLLTSGTTFIVVFIMYVWGGPGIHAFSYALLAGILFGTYSSVAVASPLLLGFKQALVAKATGPAPAPA